MEYEKDFEDGFEYTSLGAIHYKHHKGTKEKLIFLHGLGATTKVFAKLMEFMPDDLDIFLLDLLGHGESDKPEIDYSVSIQFQALREFISLRNNGDSYIFGHSYGGWIAAYYASQPYSCKGIILEDANGLKEIADSIRNREEYKKSLLDSLLKVNNNKEYVLKSILDTDLFGEDHLGKEELSMIKKPTLIILGSEDKTLDVRFAKIFAQDIKNSKLEIIEGGGHNSHYTYAEKVRDLILEFINQ